MSVVQTKIQCLVLDFIDSLVMNEAYQLEVPRNDSVLSDERCQIRAFDSPSTCRKYCQLMSIAALVAEIDATSRHISQRDLYYALKLLFKNQRGQSVVNKWINLTFSSDVYTYREQHHDTRVWFNAGPEEARDENIDIRERWGIEVPGGGPSLYAAVVD